MACSTAVSLVCSSVWRQALGWTLLVLWAMEGMMAGLMGGTMGPMLTVMMLNDNVLIFLPIFLVTCLGILFGLMKIVYQEHNTNAEKQPVIEGWPLTSFLAINFLLTILLSIFILLGPRSLIVQ
jgi:hypothetical protein